MSILGPGRFVARVAQTATDVDAAIMLRGRCFRNGAGDDRDGFDERCTHVLIEQAAGGRPVACYRVLHLTGAQVADCYSAQCYGLDSLHSFPGRLAELGRFCIEPGTCDSDVLRVAWGALTRMVDDLGIRMLFGCTSFFGTDPAPYDDAFAMLATDHLAPTRWMPSSKAARTVPLGASRVHDRHRARVTIPPLLRSYIAMGGWVSDHAVVDRELDTLHVFTALEIARVPAGRARLLRAMAG